MVDIKVEVDVKKFKESMDRLSNNSIKNSIRRAVNDVAFGLVDELQNKTFSSFKNVKPNTLKLYVDKAKDNNNIIATVRYKTYNVNSNNAERNPGKYLLPNAVSGVVRHQEGYERALWFIGALKDNEFALPTEAMMKGGRMNGSLIISMLNYLRSHRGDDFRTNTSLRSFTRRGQSFFVVKRTDNSRLPPGVYMRMNTGKSNKVNALFIFTTKRPHHKPIFKFYDIGNTYVRQRLSIEIDKQIKAVTND